MPKIARTLALSAFIVFAVSGAGLAPTASAVAATAGLVGAWSFDEASGSQVVDQSGSSNDGTLSNVTRTSSGKFGGALSFDGAGSIVNVPSAPSLVLATGMTLEAWVRPTSTPSGWRDVVVKGNDDYYLMAGSDRGVPAGGGTIGNGGTKEVYGAATLAVNVWTHMAATYDGSALRFYVNGKLAGSRPERGAIESTSGPLQFGGDSVFGRYFGGEIDEVRVYDRALSESEIQEDMTTPITAVSPSDTSPPTAPGTLAATATAAGAVALSWEPASDDTGVAGYRIERCQGAGCTTFAALTEQSGPSTTYTDASTAPGTTYGYRVRAFDAAGNPGAYSNVGTATTPASQPPPSGGLVGAWSFDEAIGTDVRDASGRGNHGSAVNAARVAGKYGNALSFNGSNSRVDVPNSPSLQLTTAVTLEAWVRPTSSSSAWRDVVFKGDDNYYLMSTSGNGALPAAGGIINGAHTEAFGPSVLPVNTWSHLALTYDGARLRLFVNGSEVAGQARTGAIATSASPLQFGGDTIYGQHFAGLIDDVRVFSVARTAAQIQSDLSTGIGGGESPPPPPTDTQAPSTPTGLVVQSASASSLALAWNPATDNVGVTGYDVLRNGVTVATVTTVSATLTSLLCGTTYAFAVVAFDAAGNRSPQSVQVDVPTAPCATSAPALEQVDGGPGYYGQFSSPLPVDASYFPIGTWGSYNTTQANRDLDAGAGLNLYVWLADPCGLGTQVNGDSRFRVIYEEGENRSCVGSATSGWSVGDEVDMCCGPPNYVGGNGYNMLTSRNASLPGDGRMRYTNYGKGVMLWQSDADAARFVNLPFLSVISNDVYWFTDPNERTGSRYRVASSYGDTVERMRMLDAMDGQRKPIWNFVETGWPFTETAAQGGRSITGPEIRAAVFHSLIAGARGIIYFQHSFGGPCLGDHHTLRSNCEGTRAAVTETNALVKSIAPALNGPELTSGFTATDSVRALAKWDGSNFYVLAGSDRNVASTASFSLPCVGAGATATVLGENRTVPVSPAGGFSDAFADGNAVHVYRIDGGSKCGLG